MSEIIAWSIDYGESGYIGGGCLQRPKQPPLKIMTFHFNFASRSFVKSKAKEDTGEQNYEYKTYKNEPSEEYDQPEEDSNSSMVESTIIGSEGSDTIYFGPSEDDSSDSEEDSSEDVIESTIIGSEGSDTIYFGPSEEDNQEAENSEEEQASEGGETALDKFNYFEAEKTTYIDNWNYDAVNWYTKSDQLAVQDALENQIITVEQFGF